MKSDGTVGSAHKVASERERASLLRLVDDTTPRAIRAFVRARGSEVLAEGPSELPRLAEAMGVDGPALRRVVHLLELQGILSFTNGICELTALGYLLVPDTANSIYEQVAGSDFNRSIEECRRSLEEVLASGLPAGDPREWWANLRGESNESNLFDLLMSRRASSVAGRVFEHWRWPIPRLVVDLGAGPGTYLREALRAFPASEGIALDLHHEGGVDALSDVGAAARARVVVGDLFESDLPIGDLYLVCSVLHNWGDELALELLKNIERSMSASSMLLIVERMAVGRSESVGQALLDIDMMVVYGGRERRMAETHQLVQSAGVEVVDAWPIHGDYVALLARRRGQHGD